MSPLLRPLAVLLFVTATACAAAPKSADLVKARLVADVTRVMPGESFTLAAHLTISPGWHVYWINPGDAGQPTRLAVDLPDAFKVSAVRFPTPARFTLPGDLTAFGYERELLLTVAVTPPVDLLSSAGGVTVRAKLSYLVCNEDTCIPGRADLSLVLPVGTPGPANADLFAEWLPRFPLSKDEVAKVGSVNTESTPPAYKLTVNWSGKTAPKSVDFIPGPSPLLAVQPPRVTSAENRTEITFTAAPLADRQPPAVLPSLVTFAAPDGTPRSIEVEVPISSNGATAGRR